MPVFQRQPIAAALALTLLTRAIPAATEEGAVTRGEYLVRAGGCFSCHTAAGGQMLAGGRALATPFGDLLQSEHHARSGNRRRPLDGRAVPAGAARGGAHRRGELLPSVSVYELHWDYRQRCLSNQSIPVFAPRGAPAEPGARRAFPALLALPANRLETVVFYPRPVPADTRPKNRGAYLVTALAHCGE